jgi:hypothetical protein
MRTFFLLTPTIAALLCVLPGRMAAQDTTCEKYTTYSAECTSPCTPSSNVEVLEFTDGEGTDHPVQVPFSCKGPAGASCVKTIYVETPQPNPVCNCSPGGPNFACCNGLYACVAGRWKCANGAPSCWYPIPITCQSGQEPTCTCNKGWQCQTVSGTPIIIDTQGTGFQLTDARDGVRFELDPARRAEQLAWTAKNSRNGWLALPHDGKVRTGKDLFGNFTPQPPSDHPNGFLALAVYDEPENGGNGDGIIDWHDAVYFKLRLWIDENHDGIAQTNELYSLPAVGVYSISLTYSESKFIDKWGNQFRYKGKVNVGGNPPGDPTDRVIYDVFLQSDNAFKRSKGCGNTENTLLEEHLLK